MRAGSAVVGCVVGRYRWFVGLLVLFFGLSSLSPQSALAQGPPGSSGGTWKIQVSYSGNASTNSTPQPPADYFGSLVSNGSGSGLSANPSLDLSTLTNQPPQTASGGISARIQAWTDRAQSNGSGTLTITLTWQPKGNDPILDAPPNLVRVYYRRLVQAGGVAQVTGSSGSAQYSASSTCGSITGSDSQSTSTAPDYQSHSNGGLDPAFIAETWLVSTSGTASKQFTLSWNLTSTTNGPSGYPGGGQAGAHAAVSLGVDFCLSGFDPARLGAQSGNNQTTSSDPSYTRALPLAFSPVLNSQPFRTQPGALPTPWGNLNCAYSIALRQEPASANLDLNNSTVPYLPSPGSDGTYNSPGPPYIPLPGPLLPQYAITDATGDRLLFSAGWQPYSDLHSILAFPPTAPPNTIQLTHAGPPGSLKEKGTYTYTFTLVQTTPLVALLTSITDIFGNTQSLLWGGTDPFLTVVDSSTGTSFGSGRTLVFHAGANGYLSGVDAPFPGTSQVFTHTATSFDSGGHLTDLQIYPGGSSTAARSDHYTYTGDSVATVRQGVGIASYSYLSDNLIPDPFGNPIPRLSSLTLGDPGDTSSTANGSSVAGTYTFTYGTIQQGYNHWGIDARTNTTTDPNGNLFKTVFTLSGGTSGPINVLTTTGPDYAGAPSSGLNFTQSLFTNDIIAPTSIVTYISQTPAPWELDFDSLGNLTRSLDPLGNVWQLGYSSDGLALTSLTDPTGITWNFQYDLTETRLASIVDPSGAQQETLTYNTFGQPVLMTVPAAVAASGGDERTTLTYDPVTGDLTRITDPLSNVFTVNAYDALGDPLSVSVYPDTGDPSNSTTPLTGSAVWNAAQQLAQVTLPTGVSIQNSYTNGILTQIQTHAPPAAGGTLLDQLSLSYDSRGRLYSSSDLIGVLGQARYDANSNLTESIDGNGKITRYAYGANNELTRIIWPDFSSASLSYNGNGTPATFTDARNIVTQYQWDATFNLTDVQFPATPSQNEHITLDGAGRVLNVRDASGSRTYIYDPVYKRLSQVVTTISALPAGHNTFTVSYSYYGDGTVSAMISPVGTTSYTYRADGLLSSLTDPYGSVTNWSYDHAGRTTAQTTHTAAGAQIATTYVYGPSGQPGDPSTAPFYLRAIHQSLNGQPLWDYTLTYDYLGQLLSEQGVGAQSGQVRSSTYSYDQRGRLTGEQALFSPDGQHSYPFTGSYTYDLADNLMGGTGGWTYNQNNQLTSAPAAGGLPGASGLSYDASGNLTSFNGHTLSYDAQGQLTGADGSISYTYNADGNRVSKSVNGQATYYLYDGDSLIAELDGNGNVTRSYTWGSQGLLSDHTGDASTGSSEFYLTDARGNTSTIVRDTNQIVRELYDTAWGQQLGDPSSTITPFGWQGSSGAFTDGELNLISGVGERPYAPMLGRPTTPGSPFSSPTFNPYAYPGNNPVSNGLPDTPDDDWVGIGSGISDKGFYSGYLGAVHTMAGVGKTALSVAASFNPIAMVGEGIGGQDIYGCKVSKGQQVVDLAMAGLPIAGGVVRNATNIAKVAREQTPAEKVAYDFNNLDKIAEDLHSVLQGRALNSTTAAGSAMYNGERVIVVSRNGGLTKAQIEEAKRLGYHFFTSRRLRGEHAEEYMIRVGEKKGYVFNGQGMGVSNPNGICPECWQNWLKPRNIKPHSPLGRKWYW